LLDSFALSYTFFIVHKCVNFCQDKTIENYSYDFIRQFQQCFLSLQKIYAASAALLPDIR